MVVDTQLLANQLKQHALECLEQLQGYRAIEENFKRAAKAYTILTGKEIEMPEGTVARGMGSAKSGPVEGTPRVKANGKRSARDIAMDHLSGHPTATTRDIHEAANEECTLTALSAAMHDLKKRGVIGARSTVGNAIVYFLRNKSADVKNETQGAPGASVEQAGKERTPKGESQRKILHYLTQHKDARIGEIKTGTGVPAPESALERMQAKKLVSRKGTRETGVLWNIAAPGKNYLAEMVPHLSTAQMSNSLSH